MRQAGRESVNGARSVRSGTDSETASSLNSADAVAGMDGLLKFLVPSFQRIACR